MHVKVLYFEDCPNWTLACQRLADALSAVGLLGEVDVSYRKVASPDEAERVGFHGSPTILIDGRDPWADEDAPVGWACRIYRTEVGAEGAPSAAQLAEVLGR